MFDPEHRFTRTAQDVAAVRAVLGEAGKHIQVIAKIETADGLEHVDNIVQAADGVMVCRNNLSVDIPIQDVGYGCKGWGVVGGYVEIVVCFLFVFFVCFFFFFFFFYEIDHLFDC
jgi:hypothetical protein